ncbi:5-(carboxyamino)imidazole ribonucleotide mutase [Synechococcus sp. JA-2-3B'a(2-13)]|jgi:5-(carboxyamino)imidazole ribonucleotide mutase|uniref:5-(carboxyamino)imidazole ribonucleotide mutase n=1 Tax=Synechococcus sp. (strain JA-2-3B'a(2-13)) TaxID=321332 RepID=UPI0000694D4B|nr:5-(carboxyamino)imidazole ribonucleotide mutase [Synechococcus sp. JA-2-3B'a(2-13)]ABD02009.1 phosphoribosylaminoimidazole carboxylase, catalytic subunit [Synechococcus sp. JA-2-3B'a(2-13)]
MELSPLVAIVMGSDSDLPTLAPAAQVCEEFGIPYQLQILSAHRTPEAMVEFARRAHTQGIRVIIAGAGGAAHLPGMVASLTPLPVIGVPVLSPSLQGIDSLYSIVQMPKGIPVATVAIGNGYNAGLLAVQILASGDPDLLRRVIAYRESLKQAVQEKNDQLQTQGWKAYLDSIKHKSII